MKNPTYEEIEENIKARVPFVTKSIWSTIDTRGYVVYSYTRLIYSDTGGFDDTHYSGTVTRHQNLVRKHLEHLKKTNPHHREIVNQRLKAFETPRRMRYHEDW